MLLEYIAERMRVNGRLVEKGGMKMVLIDQNEKLPEP
jgi:hypothetical protein